MNTIYHIEPLVLLEDEPVPDFKTDELQLISYSRAVAGAAIGSRGPFTIGIFGDWGHGKTSVLKQAQSLIENQKNNEIITVWFNAWQFEREEHPIIPLIASIVREIETRHFRTEINEKLKESYKNAMNALRAIAYGFSAKSKIKFPALAEMQAGFVAKEMVARYEELKTTTDPLLESSLYYNAFELLSSETNDINKIKIVIFIDDLDRCLPPQALALLESIKLVLAQKGFIFVLAVERKIIESFLRKRYRDEFGMADYDKIGVSYLDKIVQLPLSLPPHSSRFDKFITDLLKREAFNRGDNLAIKNALLKLKKVLSIGSDHNPRSLIRFINNLIIDWSLWKTQKDDIQIEFLGVCAVSRIIQQHLGERLFNFCFKHSEVRDSIRKRLELTHKKEITEEFLLEGVEVSHSIDPSGPKRWLIPIINEIITKLEQADFLVLLFKTEPGESWLNNDKIREEIHLFLLEQSHIDPDSENIQTMITDHQIWLQSKHKKGEQLNLTGYSLEHYDFSNQKLNKAKMSGARLSQCDFSNAKLKATDFSDSVIVNANLSGAKLNNSNFRNAYLRRADLSNADLSNADMSDATLTQANFKNANTNQTIFHNADLTDAKLMRSQIQDSVGGTPARTPNYYLDDE